MPPRKPKAAGEKSAKVSGAHKQKRIGVNFTEEWHAVARKLAGRTKTPVLWYLLGLLQEEAKKANVPTPPVPWEQE